MEIQQLDEWIKGSILKGASDITYEIISTDGEGYWSIIYKITYEKDHRKRSLIAKLFPGVKGNMKREAVDAYKREIMIYSEILPHLRNLFEAMNDKHEYFSPEYFGELQSEALILENLKDLGFRTANRKYQLSFDQMSLVIKNLSLLHGLSHLAVKKGLIDPSKLPFYPLADDLENSISLINSGLKMLSYTMLKYWDPEWHDIAMKIREIQPTAHKRLQALMKLKDGGFNVLNHGDCWTCNLMFRYDNGKPVANKLFDYQFSHYNSFAIDFGNVILTSFTYENKQNHLDTLINIYIEGLTAVLSNFPSAHVPNMTEIKQEMRRTAFQRLIMMAVFLPIMINPSDERIDLQKYFNDDLNEPCEQLVKLYMSQKYINQAMLNLQELKECGVFD